MSDLLSPIPCCRWYFAFLCFGVCANYGRSKRHNGCQGAGSKGQVDGLASDIRTMHERLDSTVTSTITRFNQLDLAQTATRNTLDTILACLDALTAKMEKDYGSDTEQDEVDRRGRARRVVCHTPNDSFAKIKFTIPSFNGKYDPAAYLDWELEVEHKFSCHDIPATQVKAAISENLLILL
jgi:hypothetical protein